MTKREFLDIVFALAPNEANKIMDAFDEYVESAQLGTNLAEVGTDCISRQAAIDALAKFVPYAICDESTESYTNGLKDAYNLICQLPSAQPETAKRIVGKSRNGMTLWYQCDMCNEPVDAQDNFCRGCGRRLTDG